MKRDPRLRAPRHIHLLEGLDLAVDQYTGLAGRRAAEFSLEFSAHQFGDAHRPLGIGVVFDLRGVLLHENVAPGEVVGHLEAADLEAGSARDGAGGRQIELIEAGLGAADAARRGADQHAQRQRGGHRRLSTPNPRQDRLTHRQASSMTPPRAVVAAEQ